MLDDKAAKVLKGFDVCLDGSVQLSKWLIVVKHGRKGRMKDVCRSFYERTIK